MIQINSKNNLIIITQMVIKIPMIRVMVWLIIFQLYKMIIMINPMNNHKVIFQIKIITHLIILINLIKIKLMKINLIINLLLITHLRMIHQMIKTVYPIIMKVLLMIYLMTKIVHLMIKIKFQVIDLKIKMVHPTIK